MLFCKNKTLYDQIFKNFFLNYICGISIYPHFVYLLIMNNIGIRVNLILPNRIFNSKNWKNLLNNLGIFEKKYVPKTTGSRNCLLLIDSPISKMNT